MSMIRALGVAVIINGATAGNLLETAVYDQHAGGTVHTKAVHRHIPRNALQRWDTTPGKLTITTDQLLGSGFEACPC